MPELQTEKKKESLILNKPEETPTPEQPVGHERLESQGAKTPQTTTELPAPPSQDQTPTSLVTAKDPELVAIETILAEGMAPFFIALSQRQQMEFKIAGEAAATKIKAVIQKGHYKIRDIVSVIISWLKTLPGINRYFLEQEAKIKADKIVRRYTS